MTKIPPVLRKYVRKRCFPEQADVESAVIDLLKEIGIDNSIKSLPMMQWFFLQVQKATVRAFGRKGKILQQRNVHAGAWLNGPRPVKQLVFFFRRKRRCDFNGMPQPLPDRLYAQLRQKITQ